MRDVGRTAVIADDEPLLLDELRELLAEAWPELAIVGAAGNGAEALRLIGTLRPHVAFLDIEMPRIDGLAVAAASGETRVVFVTAYERYAVTAFERGAADYLLKPVTPSRMGLAVQRLKSEWPAPTAGLRFVQAWVGNTMRVVPVHDIVAFLSEDKCTRVVTATGNLWVRRSLVDLCRNLDGDVFWPIARGVVIHARYIERVERGDGQELLVRMASLNQPLAVGRAHRQRFRGM